MTFEDTDLPNRTAPDRQDTSRSDSAAAICAEPSFSLSPFQGISGSHTGRFGSHASVFSSVRFVTRVHRVGVPSPGHVAGIITRRRLLCGGRCAVWLEDGWDRSLRYGWSHLDRLFEKNGWTGRHPTAARRMVPPERDRPGPDRTEVPAAPAPPSHRPAGPHRSP